MSDPLLTQYDAVVIGGGHNGLVSAAYLGHAGLSVLVLERGEELGGATRSKRIFPDFDARISAYSYLVSLFPRKIIQDLGLNLPLRSRRTSSWNPSIIDGRWRELLVRNGEPDANREAFGELTGNDHDYRGYFRLQEMQEQLAGIIWPSLVEPLVTREEMRNRLGIAGSEAWKRLIEEPLGMVIEELIEDDLIRGIVFTDGKIGLPVGPHDEDLLQNRCFLYHVIGQGTGEWLVPVGGMGSLVTELERAAHASGKVTFATRASVETIEPGLKKSAIAFDWDGESREVDARYVLCNASAQVLETLTNGQIPAASGVEGAGFKINMLLERLPRLRSNKTTASEAFAGTVHIDEGYEQMIVSLRQSLSGEVPTVAPGEIYCHTLTDDSILSDDLSRQGYHTLTLFGLDMPYRLFQSDNDRVREAVLAKYLQGINRVLDEPIESCLARGSDEKPCIEAMSAVDLENKLHLPRGNIFHGDLTWPFAGSVEESETWGVETSHPGVFLCGSAAKRGGAVSGIPGHNAARKVLES